MSQNSSNRPHGENKSQENEKKKTQGNNNIPPPVKSNRGSGRGKKKRKRGRKRGRRKGRGSYRKNRRKRKSNSDFQAKVNTLSDHDRGFFERNEHVQQCVQYEGVKIHQGEFREENRILRDYAPVKKYIRRKHHEKTCIHWGQRKLLLSEIEFLTKHSSKEVNIVIYAGAAPGTKTNFLSQLFPHCLFLLVDPSPFLCKETEQIKINPDSKRGFFTDELAGFYREKYDGKILFISDIRTASWKQMNEEEIEEQVMKDMKNQERWVRIMCPVASLLKFRLPYGNSVNKSLEKVSYLPGDIYLPVWGPITTTECRLMVTEPTKTKFYDHVKYEGQMFYFNTFTRTTIFKHRLFGDPRGIEFGLDGCYDCTSEIHICSEYLTKFGPKKELWKNDDLLGMIRNIELNSAQSGRRLRGGNIRLPGLDVSQDDMVRHESLMSLDVEKESDMRKEDDEDFQRMNVVPYGARRKKKKKKKSKRSSSSAPPEPPREVEEEEEGEEEDGNLTGKKRKLEKIEEEEPLVSKEDEVQYINREEKEASGKEEIKVEESPLKKQKL